MKNNFTSLFEDQSRDKLGITKNEVERALEYPDKEQTLDLEKIEKRLVGGSNTPPFVPTFYLSRRKESGYLLIATRIKNKIRDIDYALEIFPEFLKENIKDLTPLELLKSLAISFGLEIKVGDKSGKVISESVIPFEEETGKEIVVIENPKNHSFLNTFFLRIDREKKKIICALALCIDTTRYLAWKRAREENYLTEVRKIIEGNKIIKDKGKRFNLNELGIALVIIRKFLGEEFYRKVLKKLDTESIKDKEYRKIVKREEIHPLSKALWSGKPEDFIRVINLGQFLLQLWKPDDSNNLFEKLDELKKYSFSKTYFELKTACYSERRGMKIEFISEKKNKKTPDFRIICDRGKANVECKKRDPESGFDLENLLIKAASQLEEFYNEDGDPGIIFIELNDVPSNPEIIQEQINTHLKYKEWVDCVVTTVEKIVKERDFIKQITIAHRFKNPNSKCELPDKIRESVSILTIPRLPSLQERFR